MPYKKCRGISLVELIVVIIIIAILASLALPQFTKTKERAWDKEATINLKLIRAAGKLYRMENTFYYPYTGYAPANTDDINTNLKLSLTTKNWIYSILTPLSGTATASRVGADRTWTLTMTDADGEPDCTGTYYP